MNITREDMKEIVSINKPDTCIERVVHDVEDLLNFIDERRKRYQTALEHIYENFDDLNATECTRHCGKCIKCICEEALRPDP
jgi:hypothetical protein